MISPAGVTNCYILTKSNTLNVSHWKVPAFHRLHYHCIIYAKIIIFYQPYFSVIKERLGVPVRAKARLPKSGACIRSRLRCGPECRWCGHWDPQKAITTHEAKGFQMKTDLKTGSFTHRCVRKGSLIQ